MAGVARFDKVDPYSGGFRARLDVDWLAADIGVAIGVGLTANGRVVKGAGNTGVLGMVALGMARKAGEPVDVMTSGEIVDVAGLIAGTRYFSTTAGAVNTTGTGVYVGHTVEADRLVVRVARLSGA